MVATKATQKRRGGFNGVSNRPRFKTGGGPKSMNPRNIGAMFNVNQLGDNPGFVDFNDDVQIPAAPAPQVSSSASPANADTTVAATTSQGARTTTNRKGNPNQKRSNMRNGNNMRRMPPGMSGSWGPPIPPIPPMYPMGGGRRNGPFPPPLPPPHFRVPPMGMRGMRGGPMMPPPPPNGRFGGPSMGPGPVSLMQRPIPPMPPMRGPIMNPMGRIMPPLRNGPPPMRRVPNGKMPPGGRTVKPGGKLPIRASASTAKGSKLLPNKKPRTKMPVKPREEYPLDKPWVTSEIKEEHEKKVQLAERLKGHKDDALFAQFKEQRDKFVKMYDAARLEFIGKHPEQDVDKILTESMASKKAKTENTKSNDAVSTDTPAATDSATTTTATTTNATATDAGKTSASSA
ncbi:DNA-binding protein K10-like [Sabethes cyaneus]|uniref:DNA-binding protein K10-like n=1 Tax=Sabethes cyaneus TaxID=53552 RepID=UPI00237E2714|nr:DNA-binding protein K10-like [Sabethes cyaneus]